MKQIYKVHVRLPDNFEEQKIIGFDNPLKDFSEIILAGYLEYPADTTQSIRVEIRVPFYDAEQGQRFKRVLSGLKD